MMDRDRFDYIVVGAGAAGCVVANRLSANPENNMRAALGEYASWGYFDYRMAGEGYEQGYQSVPVDWGIHSERKRGFFDLLKQVTGV